MRSKILVIMLSKEERKELQGLIKLFIRIMEYNAATATDDLWAYLLAKYLYISNIKNKSENNNKKTNQKKPQI